MSRVIYILILTNFLFKFTFGQDFNSSFIFSDFSTLTNMPIASLSSTDDGGFAYVKCFQPWAFSKTDSNKLKVISFSKPENTANYGNSDIVCVFLKVGKDMKINFARLLDNYSGGLCLKQTKDEGYIITGYANITKLDKYGNKKWQLFLNKDSIPGIKKSKFLSETPINNITECKDGSFIALLDASFSLLKISKDGKPLWLKSTVFDEFSPMYFDYYTEQKQWIEKTDSVGINKFIYERGGGVYIPTYNVYETDDNGYMAIGKNEYRNKEFITNYTDSNKVFFTTKDTLNGNFKRIGVPQPEKIYGIRKYPLTEEEKNVFPKQSTTVVVKTDKNGNVLWVNQFGEMSYDTKPHSDLIKLSNGKWLVRIRDCDSTGIDNWGKISFGSPHSEFYIIDNNGNILKKPNFGQSKYLCDPFSMAMATDSSFYFYEQGIVSKADKSMSILWQKSFGGWLTDVGIHAVTDDTGVLSTERGVIFKFNQLGKNPNDSVAINISKVTPPVDSSTQLKPFLHIDFYCPSKTEILNVVIERKDVKEMKNEDIVRYAYIIEDHSFESREEIALKNKRKYEKSEKKKKKIYEMPWYMFISEVNIGRYNSTLKSYILDISDTCQIRGLFCEQKKDTLPAVMVDIPYLYGYREVYLTDLAAGNYVCKIINSETLAVLWKKEFTWKP